MNKRTTTILTSLALVFGLISFMSTPVQAGCRTVYGGGEVCDEFQIDLNKVVWNPDKSEWWDNIDSSSYLFKNDQEVRYELRVKNISDHKIEEVTLRDILPDHLNWVSGGSWSSSSRTSEFKIHDLDPDETVTRVVTAKFADKDNIPSGITCVTNKGEAYAKDNGSDTDTAQVCVSKEAKVLGVTTLPSTGPQISWLLLAELVALAGLGIAYIKVAKH